MRLRRKKWAKPELEKDKKYIFQPSEFKGKWREVFNNDDPIHLELGCGRGRFIAELAEINKHINYIAIDVYDELLVYVLRKANEKQLDNLIILQLDIENIENIFAPEEIERIYLNFSTPWPSRRHHRKRLTYPNFLQKYKTFLKESAEIWFKTDNEPFFLDSLKYFESEGFECTYITYDLHQSDFVGNIMTEYESKFSQQGMNIKFGKFVLKERH